jgi:hypothetical protein
MGAGASPSEAIFGTPEIMEAAKTPVSNLLFLAGQEPPALKPVKPEFKRRRRRRTELFDLFGTLLTEPQTGALTQQATTEPKKLLGA